MGYFFLKNWYLYGSTFKFRGATSYQTKLEYPPGPGSGNYAVSHSVQRLKPTLFIFVPPFISNHTFYKNKHTHPFADHVFQK